MYRINDIKEIEFESIDSTQLFLLEKEDELDNLTFVRANTQTNGHGRMKRIWKSDSCNLLFSFLIKDEYLLNRFSSLSLLIGTAIYNSLKEFNIDSLIKWPNDIYVNNKKICGIILESSSYNNLDSIVIGVGLNVNMTNFDELVATSMNKETGIIYDIKDVKNVVYENIINSLNKFMNDEHFYIDIINKNNYLLNKPVLIYPNESKIKGVVRKVKEDNSLLVEVDDKEISVRSDEVFILN